MRRAWNHALSQARARRHSRWGVLFLGVFGPWPARSQCRITNTKAVRDLTPGVIFVSETLRKLASKQVTIPWRRRAHSASWMASCGSQHTYPACMIERSRQHSFWTTPVARCLGRTAARPDAVAYPRSRTVSAVAAVSSTDPAPPRSVPTRSARRTVGHPITTGHTPMRGEDPNARGKIPRA